MTGDIQLFSRITSKDGASSSMEISQTSITKNGVKTVLHDEVINLTTNTVDGDKSNDASAILSIPVDQKSLPKISTIGNATVSNSQGHFTIKIIDDQKKLSPKSKNGLFASIKISKQGDSNFSYLTILFGPEGIKEFINKDGRKNRSDIAIYPNGNGKFIRLSDAVGDYDPTWLFENNLTYNPSQKAIYPSQVIITSTKYSDKLFLNFEFDMKTSTVCLMNAIFE